MTHLGHGATRLRSFVRPAVRERCELCGDELQQDHAHMLQAGKHTLRCACDTCGVSHADRPGWQRIRTRLDPVDMAVDDALWVSLGIPINLAYLLQRDAEADPVALFPSPAGLTETPLPPSGFMALLDLAEPLRASIGRGEALLALRLTAPHRYYIASLDICYELAGLLRHHWRGVGGGADVVALLETFVRERAHA